jgi:hypothetical protein
MPYNNHDKIKQIAGFQIKGQMHIVLRIVESCVSKMICSIIEYE